MNSQSNGSNLRWLVQSTLGRASQHVGIWDHGLETIDVHPIDASIDSLSTVFETTGKQVGLQVVRTRIQDPVEVSELLRGGMAVILLKCEPETSDLQFQAFLLTSCSRSRFSAISYRDYSVESVALSRAELREFASQSGVSILAVKPLQNCDSISANPVYAQVKQLMASESGDFHDHISPLRRFLGLLHMERKDIGLVAIFGFASSVLSLATPLAVESLVNVISWGVYIQPLIVLALMLLCSLVLSSVFGVLQNMIVEVVQRRQFVHIVCDLAHRFPVCNRQQLKSEFPRELANRVLDIMAIQKASSVLLLDGTNIVIVSIVGFLLLGFYHAYLLGLVIVLIVSMTLVIWLLGRGGVTTAIEESKTKYRMVHWLQDVLDSPAAFRVNGGDLLAIKRASAIAAEYVEARKKHFTVLLRQIIFAAGLQAVAMTSVLGIGGWLVMQGSLTLGQLVAAELVVALVVGSYSKAGKSLEKFYDLLASIDKVGHLLDLKADSNVLIDMPQNGPLPLEWTALEIDCGLSSVSTSPGSITAGTLSAILVAEPLPRIAETLAGLLPAESGSIRIQNTDVTAVAVAAHQGTQVSLAARTEIFMGSIASNIDLGRNFVSLASVRETLKKVQLWEDLAKVPTGINTILQSSGYPLSPIQMNKLILARSLVSTPRLLIIDGLLDSMSPEDQRHLLDLFQSLKTNCTILLITQLTHLADQSDLSHDWRRS